MLVGSGSAAPPLPLVAAPEPPAPPFAARPLVVPLPLAPPPLAVEPALELAPPSAELPAAAPFGGLLVLPQAMSAPRTTIAPPAVTPKPTR